MNFDSRYQHFIENIPDGNLSNFLGLINTQDEKSTINFLRISNYMYLKIAFRKLLYKNEADYIRKNNIGLPIEINNIIADFILEEKKLALNIVMFYPQLYPFCRPYVDIIDINVNFKTSIDLNNYFKVLCNYHNKREWNTLVTIDKDILDLYITLNKFEYLLKN